MKIVADVADGTATLELDPDRVRPVQVGDAGERLARRPEGRLLTPRTLDIERDIYERRYRLAVEYATANGIALDDDFADPALVNQLFVCWCGSIGALLWGLADDRWVFSPWVKLAGQTALGVPGTVNDAANPVDWTRLKGVPAGFGVGCGASHNGIWPQRSRRNHGIWAQPNMRNHGIWAQRELERFC